VVRHFESEGRRPLLVLHERWLSPETDLAVHRTKGYKQNRKKAHSANRQRFDRQLAVGDLPEATGVKLPEGTKGPTEGTVEGTVDAQVAGEGVEVGSKRPRPCNGAEGEDRTITAVSVDGEGDHAGASMVVGGSVTASEGGPPPASALDTDSDGDGDDDDDDDDDDMGDGSGDLSMARQS